MAQKVVRMSAFSNYPSKENRLILWLGKLSIYFLVLDYILVPANVCLHYTNFYY